MPESVLMIFPFYLREILKKLELKEDLLEEIRLRVNKPLIFSYAQEEWFLNTKEGCLTTEQALAYCVTSEDLQEMLAYLSSYSVYAFEDEIKGGFITLSGGHRVGVAGHVVVNGGEIIRVQFLYFLNIRIAKEIKGCAGKLLPYLLQNDLIFNTLIFSAPGVGKTTYLRDLIRILSDGTPIIRGKKISVIDERSEIAACDRGIPQNDIGIRSDVIDNCPKSQGMLLALRSLSPQIIAVDELGSREDFLAVERIIHCGCRILGTVHAENMTEIDQKLGWLEWEGKRMFGRFVWLYREKSGRPAFQVFDEEKRRLC